MFMEDHKIQTRNYFGGNILLQPAYEHLIKTDPIITYPNATAATKNTFFLGTSPVITDQHLDYIQQTVDAFLIRM
jgi:CDP-6-deoxy-D-xylo-4-hexulose-3-dehydrase